MIRGMQLLLACGIILASLPTQVSATIIGPDAFGYTATDEVRPELFFPLGTTLGLTDESYALISSGTFQFPFYGNVYSTFAIGSNGTISFDDALLGFNNKSIPGPSGYSPDQFIAVYWDDLVPTSNVRYTFFGTGASERLIVHWDNVSRFGPSGTGVNIEATLYQNGDIQLHYFNPSDQAGASATVGIQGSSTLGLQWSFNQAVLTNSQTILFHASPPVTVPEPSALTLLGLGACGLLATARRRRLPCSPLRVSM